MANATRRIVLERRMVVDAAPDYRNSDEDPLRSFEAWVEVAREEGATSDEAVDAYAGKSFSPDSKPGIRRAPSLQSWGVPRITEK